MLSVKAESMIVSVSRREDVPRYRVDFFMNRLREGWTTVVNPYDPRKERKVSLLPQDVDALVFWTRDPRPMLPYLDELEGRGYFFYFMVTVTGYPPELERGGPVGEEGVGALRALAARIGRGRCVWRYDPVFLSSLTDGDFHRRNFARLAALLGGAVFRVVLSCYDGYTAARRRLVELGCRTGLQVFPMREETGSGKNRGLLLPEVRDLLRDLGRSAAAAGIEARTCAEGEDPAELGMGPNSCVDGELIAALRSGSGDVGAASGLAQLELSLNVPQGPRRVGVGGGYPRDKNQRPNCRCAASVDIGTYGLCPAGCVYCYAWR